MNMFRTALLMAVLTALVMAVGVALGGQQGLVMALVMAGAMNLFAYWNSDKIVLRLYKAREVTEGPVYTLTESLAKKANLPLPRVYIMDQSQPNAFATGRNPENGAVAVTTGLMKILDERELAGVIAHELAHIQNRDTLIMTITATLAGALSMLANMFMFFGRGNRESPVGGAAALALMILSPLVAMLVQMAISRTREYSADRDGAMICGDPMALASALKKLQAASLRIDNNVAERNPATAPLFIVNPLHALKSDALFSTHPSTENRVRALEALAQQGFAAPPSSRRGSRGIPRV